MSQSGDQMSQNPEVYRTSLPVRPRPVYSLLTLIKRAPLLRADPSPARHPSALKCWLRRLLHALLPRHASIDYCYMRVLFLLFCGRGEGRVFFGWGEGPECSGVPVRSLRSSTVVDCLPDASNACSGGIYGVWQHVFR